MSEEQRLSAEQLDSIIEEHLRKHTEQSLFRASLEHFWCTGRPSGSFRASLHEMLKEYSSLQNKSLSERVKELEEENQSLRKQLHDHNGFCQQKLSEQLSQILPEINELKEENKKLRELQRWIPVEERLPEKEVDVVILINNDPVIAQRIILPKYPECVWLTGDGTYPQYEIVTHWMPLPKPLNP